MELNAANAALFETFLELFGNRRTWYCRTSPCRLAERTTICT